jgi:hypothetical protein
VLRHVTPRDCAPSLQKGFPHARKQLGDGVPSASEAALGQVQGRVELRGPPQRNPVLLAAGRAPTLELPESNEGGLE